MTDLTNAVKDALVREVYCAEQFVKIEFPDETWRRWTGSTPILLDGELYEPSGELLDIPLISETSDGSVNSVQIELSGLSTDLFAKVRNIRHQGSAVTIKEAQFSNAGTVIPDAYTLFSGVIDTMESALGNDLTVTINVESYMRMILRGPDGHRRTQADQELCFPGSGDLGLEFAGLLGEQIPWNVTDKLIAKGGLTNL